MLSLDPILPEDTPVITTAAVGASAASTIAGSAGWWREKREGVAETVPGGSQSSSNVLDVSGSTYFRYPGVFSGAGHAANPGNYVRSDMKPGGTPQSARWIFAVSFVTESPTVEIRMRAPVANPYTGLVFVNGRRVDERVIPTDGVAAGSGYGVKLEFPSEAERTITLYGLGQGEGGFGGVAVEAGYTVTAQPAPGRSIAIIGDSYVNGSSGVSSTETFVWRLALHMGAGEIIQAGIGGTGWTQALSGEPTSIFSGRIADVMSMSPDVVIFAGGRNDGPTGLQQAVEDALDAVGDSVERWVIPTASEATQASTRTALEAASAAKNVPFLDVAVDSLPKIADNIHPTWEGHQTLADNAFALMAAPVGPYLTEWDGTTTTPLSLIEWDGSAAVPLTLTINP